MHFLAGTALCLSLIHHSAARLPLSPHSFRQLAQRDADPQPNNNGGLLSWLGQMVKSSLQRRQTVCYEDEYYDFVNNSTFGETFCQVYMKYPNITTTIDYTPGITQSSIVTTFVYTDRELIRTTPVTTVTTTVTPAAVVRRDPDAPAARLVKDAFALFVRQTNGTAPGLNAMSAAFSSACACQTYTGAVVTETYTDEPTVITTVKGFARTTTTVFTTRTAGALTSTITVTASPSTAPQSSESASGPTSSSASASSAISTSATVSMSSSSSNLPVFPVSSGYASSPPPNSGSAVSSGSSSTISSTSTSPLPTAMPFTCPTDNNTIVSQMIGNQRFDYLILCDYDLPNDPTFYNRLAYETFSECAAACSMFDADFGEAFCQAAVYSNTRDVDGYNCMLKSSANMTIPVAGMNAAILQRIAVGIDTSNPNGTNTESIPFGGPTSSIAASALSAQMSSLMMNASSTSLSMITPGPAFVPSGRQVALDFTAFSTYVSGGSTYSTGSYFSTYYTSNGSWYFSYYSTYTVAWASASTVIAYGADSTQVAVTNNTSEYVQGGQNGGYVTVTNTSVTTYTYYTNETIANQTDTLVYSTFAGNNSFITASTTVTSNLYTQTYQGQSDNGGFGGVSGGGGSGPLSSNSVTLITSTTQISSPSASSAIIATPGPSISSTVIYTSFGTGGSFGGAGSGALTFTSTGPGFTSTIVSSYASSTVVVQSFNTGGSNGGFGSGAITSSSSGSGAVTPGSTGYGSAFSTEGSGAITQTPPIATAPVPSSTSSPSFTGNPRVGSGSPPATPDSSVFVSSFGTSFETSTAASGALTTSVPTLSSGPGYYPSSSPSGSSATMASSSSGLLPSSSLGTAPMSSSGTITTPSGTASSGSAPTDTASTSNPSFSNNPRSGSQSPSSDVVPPESSSSEVPVFPTSRPGYVPSLPATSSAPASSTESQSMSSSVNFSPSGTAVSPSSQPVISSSSGGTAASSSIPLSVSSSPSGTAVSPVSNTGSSSTALPTESSSGVPSNSVSSSSASFSGLPRSGSQSPPESTSIPELPTSIPHYQPTPSSSTSTPLGTAASSGMMSVPINSTTSGVASLSTAPSSSDTDTYNPSGKPRSGSLSSPASDYPPVTAPSSGFPSSGFSYSPVNSTTGGPTSYPTAPLSSDTGTYNPSDQPRSGSLSSPISNTAPVTAPSSGLPSSSIPLVTYNVTSGPLSYSTAPSSSGTYNPSDQPRSGSQSPPGSELPSSTGPSGPIATAPTAYSSSGVVPSLPVTSSPPLSTGPVTSTPVSNGTCTQGTTTIFTTVTLYGCYSQCLPNQGGYYGPGQGQSGPQSFGPP